VNFNGVLTIDISRRPLSSTPYDLTYTLASYGCYDGSFSETKIVRNGVECKESKALTQYHPTQLIVIATITPSCLPSSGALQLSFKELTFISALTLIILLRSFFFQ